MSNPDTTTECTGTTYDEVNPGHPDEGHDVHHDGPCPVHPSDGPLVLRYDRLADGTLVATASHAGRSVAAIIHARTPGDAVYDTRRWTLAGDVDPTDRPEGTEASATLACANAAAAVERVLNRAVTGYEVAR